MECLGNDITGDDEYIRAYAHRERLAPVAPRARELPSHESPNNKDAVSTGAQLSSLRGPTFNITGWRGLIAPVRVDGWVGRLGDALDS